MELTSSQKRIKDRRLLVEKSFYNKGETTISAMVKALAEKVGVSEVTIYSDLEELKLTEKHLTKSA